MTESKTFIVTLKENVSDPAITKIKEGIKAVGGEIQHEYTLIKGFSVKLPVSHLPTLKGHEDVATIEEDQEVKAN